MPVTVTRQGPNAMPCRNCLQPQTASVLSSHQASALSTPGSTCMQPPGSPQHSPGLCRHQAALRRPQHAVSLQASTQGTSPAVVRLAGTLQGTNTGQLAPGGKAAGLQPGACIEQQSERACSWRAHFQHRAGAAASLAGAPPGVQLQDKGPQVRTWLPGKAGSSN